MFFLSKPITYRRDYFVCVIAIVNMSLPIGLLTEETSMLPIENRLQHSTSFKNAWF